MEEFNLGKPFFLSLAKNPAGFNQSLRAVLTDSRRKDVIIIINDGPNDGRDVSWIWDVDFERLKNESVASITVLGERALDIALRFKYSDQSFKIAENFADAARETAASGEEVCYVLVNYTALFPAKNALEKIQKSLGRGRV
jgi:UDP-N-acetylmuramyl tripeptide synthase